MPRPRNARFPAPVERVRTLAANVLGARTDHASSDEGNREDGARGGGGGGAVAVLTVPTPSAPGPELRVVVELRAHGGETIARVWPEGRLRVPFFSWAFRPLVAVHQRRAAAHVEAALDAVVRAERPPPPPAPVIGLPDVAFAPDQAALLATAAAAAAVVAFGSGLFGQLAGPIGDSFDASDAQLGVALAATRIGALVALFVTAFADRRGRRRAILVGVVGSAVASAASAAAPSLELFAAAQVLQRACVITTATVAGIAAIEEAPHGARAYSASMLALAGGFGFSFAVISLPLADLGEQAWRIPFVISALTLVLAPVIARRLRETTRYRELASRDDVLRGRIGEVFDRRYGRRFAVLAGAGFLLGVFNAPSSQLMNTYLLDDRGFSNTGIAVFRAVTTAVPGLLGVLVAGRLAESRGRKPVAVVGLLVSTVTTMVLFLVGGPVMWVMSAVSVLLVSIGGLAIATLDVELFPTEVRGTSNALLTIVGVAGSMLGLVTAGALADSLGGIGRSIALCGVAALVAAAVFVPRLPETRHADLEAISPTESVAPTEAVGPDRTRRPEQSPQPDPSDQPGRRRQPD